MCTDSLSKWVPIFLLTVLVGCFVGHELAADRPEEFLTRRCGCESETERILLLQSEKVSADFWRNPLRRAKVDTAAGVVPAHEVWELKFVLYRKIIARSWDGKSSCAYTLVGESDFDRIAAALRRSYPGIRLEQAASARSCSRLEKALHPAEGDGQPGRMITLGHFYLTGDNRYLVISGEDFLHAFAASGRLYYFRRIGDAWHLLDFNPCSWES